MDKLQFSDTAPVRGQGKAEQMSNREPISARWARLMNRVHARLATRSKSATAFVLQPEPRTVGSMARGRQLLAGNLLFAGQLLEAKGAMVWDLHLPSPAFEEELHGFGWLDDLAAIGDGPARELAQTWVWGWIDRYGDGTGAGWLPELAGRRLIRLIHHAIFLLRGREPNQSQAFFRSLAGQSTFLARRWSSTPPGLPRFEALTGLVYAGLSLSGMEKHVDPALRGLAEECEKSIDQSGGIPTRNPEELLEVLSLLSWCSAALEETGQTASPAIEAAIARITPTLRTLRHADGSLPRFHGGGRGIEGRLDQALAASGVKGRVTEGLAMGFARLSAGRTSLIVDAAPPPGGRASLNAHASTLAFELTSGRRPVIVNCGSGAVFGSEWRRAGRATPSHSTLTLAGYSSARLGAEGKIGAATRETLEDLPVDVPFELSRLSDAVKLEVGHDGYRATHGLTVARILELTLDGRGLVGEEFLMALNQADKFAFDRVMNQIKLAGIPYAVRFHLHPDADATLDMNGQAVSVSLLSGETWVFRVDGRAQLSVEPSVYLEKGRLRPRATKQIVLQGRAMEYATRIRWSFAKAQDANVAIRDLVQDRAELQN